MEEGQKRTFEEADPSLLDEVSAVIVDIEGTTTPIEFVKECLFPYVRENLESYLSTRYDDEETQADICALREQAVKDKANNVDGTVEIPSDGSKEDVIKAVLGNVKWQMDLDRKTTELKQLQGHIWREAYKTGKVKAKVFDDVSPNFEKLVEEERLIYIYSSGSIEAQKLLFKHTECGDLSKYIKDYFDTTIGPKTEKDSYVKILEQIQCDPEEVLFLTDMPQEAEAASQAGLKTALVAREGNEELTDEHFKKFLVIESFSELFGEDDEDFKRLETEGNGEYNEDDDEDDDEDDLGDDDEDDPEDDDGEEDEEEA